MKSDQIKWNDLLSGTGPSTRCRSLPPPSPVSVLSVCFPAGEAAIMKEETAGELHWTKWPCRYVA